jgi:glycerol-3-phosphate dehydrogenase
MRRALSRLSNELFDLLIIGGGATGCFIARDAALRGLNVGLVESRDFAGETSAHNSKLAHGGLRYLRNLEFALVRESLRERRALQRIAPHLVRPLPFLLPLYDKNFLQRRVLAAGLTLYDLLSFGKGRLKDPAQRLPNHRWLDRAAALAREPVLEANSFQGAFEYHDAQMYAPERIALECLIDAEAHGAAIANHLAAEQLLLRNDKVKGVTVRDRFDGVSFDVRARLVVIAAGPWSDLFLQQATGQTAAHRLLRSKGIHLLLPPVTRATALTVEAGQGHFFVLPWRGHTLLGTTDSEFRGDPALLDVSAADMDGLLSTVNQALPAARLTRDQVEFFYAGLRPLIDDGSGQSYKASRRAELVDHGREGLDGVLSALGGKWTTSRRLAQTVVDRVARKLGARTLPCVTATTPLPGGGFDHFETLARGAEEICPGVPSIRHLAHMFGARLPLLLKGAGSADLLPLGPSGDTLAQVRFAVREEMAMTLEDVVMRRTSLGQFGPPPQIARIADVMAPLLGWNDARRKAEIDSLAPLYRIAA